MMFCSNALERVLKRSSDEIRNGGYKRFIHPDDHEEASKMEARPVDGDILIATWRFLHGDGHYVWLETTLRTVFDPTTHRPLNVISVSRDITARKEQELEATAARARAEAANQAKSRFLANMSHELRTPLNAIIGFSDLMRMRTFGPLGSTRYEDYATLIHDSGQLLLDHISDLLDMARIEAGKLELNFERVDLASTIEDTARLLRQRADAGDIALSTEVDTALLPLVADRRAVKQIIINLVSNAIKFTPPGGHVRIAAAQDDGTTRIAVSDDGIGIPASEIHRLGKPFEQVCGDPMLAKSGTGLGLALVRALAERHGGALAISSAEGVGTEVSVTFPRDSANRSAA
jgi:PAS domain S-box-containing protein